MFCTCLHVPNMAKKMIQLRHVPEDLHKKLKARAALAGMSLSDYLLQEIARLAERPTIAELWERIKRRPPVKSTINPADLVREERDRR